MFILALEHVGHAGWFSVACRGGGSVKLIGGAKQILPGTEKRRGFSAAIFAGKSDCCKKIRLRRGFGTIACQSGGILDPFVQSYVSLLNAGQR
jgi:hypothetical protein